MLVLGADMVSLNLKPQFHCQCQCRLCAPTTKFREDASSPNKICLVVPIPRPYHVTVWSDTT